MLQESEYHPYFKTYIDPLKERNESVMELMEVSAQELVDLLLQLPTKKEEFRYAEGKWTVKELVLHIIDTERVFQYRALRFARNDNAALPGFDQDVFNDNAEANNRTMQSIIDEFVAVRQASITLFDSFSETAWRRMGKASGNPISVRALGYLVSGHQLHHQRILSERYL